MFFLVSLFGVNTAPGDGLEVKQVLHAFCTRYLYPLEQAGGFLADSLFAVEVQRQMLC